MADTFHVKLNIQRTADLIESTITNGSFTGELIDRYSVGNGTNLCVVFVFEKHFYRAGNRLTLTVVLDTFGTNTRVHIVGGGGGEGLFRFDWGASNSFENEVIHTLEQYRV